MIEEPPRAVKDERRALSRPDRPFDPLQSLAEDGPGTAEIDADEAGRLVAEHPPVAEIDPGPAQEEVVEGVGRDAEGRGSRGGPGRSPRAG